MYKLSPTLTILLLLGGCAMSRPQPRALVAESSSSVRAVTRAAAAEPVESVDIEDFDYETVCEQVTRPGSRIVIEEHCYTPDENEADQALQDEIVRRQIEMLRQEQQRLARQQRQRELERRRELLRRAMQRR